MRPVDVHLSVQVVGEKEVVGQFQPVRLHRVAGPIVVVPDIACKRASKDLRRRL